MTIHKIFLAIAIGFIMGTINTSYKKNVEIEALKAQALKSHCTGEITYPEMK